MTAIFRNILGNFALEQEKIVHRVTPVGLKDFAFSVSFEK